MTTEIVQYLYSFKDYKYHSLNSFLKETFHSEDLNNIRRALSELVKSDRIEIENDSYQKLASHSRINDTDSMNSYRDLDNLPIMARLSFLEKERLKADEIKRQPNNIVNIGTNQNSPIFQDIKSERDFKPIINPPIVPTTADTKQGKIKSIISFILKNIVLVIILGIIAGLVVAYYTHLFKWNK